MSRTFDLMKSLKSLFTGAAAMIAGYGVIVALTTLGFNVWLEGRALYGRGPLLLFQGTIVAVGAGLAGGMVAALIGRRRPILHAALVLVPLALDTTWVLFFSPRRAPVWFDALGSATLMLFTMAGGGIVLLVLRSRQRDKT